MAFINYNIANRKCINRIRFLIPAILLVFLGFGLFYIAFNNIHITNSKLSDKINKKNFYKDESGKMSKRMRELQTKINSIKLIWDSKVRFVNGSIKYKTRSSLDILNFLERVLPESVSVIDLSIVNSAKRVVRITVVSDSTEKLYKLYKKLLGYDLEILSENESENLYKSKLRIKYSDEKN